MTQGIPLYLWGTVVIWVILVLVSSFQMRGQRIEDIKTNLMKSTVLAMSTAIAVSLAGSVIYFVVMFQSQSIPDQSSEIPDSFKLAALLGSAVLVIWTSSTFWAEVKKLTTKKDTAVPTPEAGDQRVTRPDLPMTLQVELPVARWGQPSPVKMTVSGGTTIADLFSKMVKEYTLPSDRTYYIDTGSRIIGPEHYKGTLEASGIKNGQKIAITDTPSLSSLGYKPVSPEVAQQTVQSLSGKGMRVRLGTLEIGEPEITYAHYIAVGYGFEFKGLAPNEKGRQIIDQLTRIKQGDLLQCEAVIHGGKRLSGYGKLETFESQIETGTPVIYRFSGSVRLMN